LWDSGAVRIRERAEADLGRCVELARVVHETDGYPVYLPDDLRSFLAVPHAIGAWVAERAGDVIGHVALHQRSSAAVMALAEAATGLPAPRLGVVARLLVAPTARRAGIGRALLDVAADRAVQLGRWPVLDVVTRHESGIKLYEAAGWSHAGQVTVTLGGVGPIEELVFLGPPPPQMQSPA
jgi:GNAT superfamily N-acetyltransferase